MKKEITKLLALLIFGAAALSGCSIENHRGRRNYDRYHHDRYHNDHHDNRYNDHNRGY
ncbi:MULTISPECIES: hypothetical protein [unclassified Mucilaginibacter]|uniref:hypothetical protein n=1 Tax=unclassified Mucilaginibacter TaxID=2617802 RepID=UPI00138B9BAF|nr:MULTISPECIES: hypothetical protein [unclassified Mucilaginibacter]QHS56171.1 hypothetical protein GWR56_11715 [Mucilaginibacter sp. 14171R-50]